MFGSIQCCKRQYTHCLFVVLCLYVIITNISPVLSSSDYDERIPFKFAVEPTLPGAIIFNVDEVIWPFKVDKVMTPPLSINGRNKDEIKDRMGKVYALYNDTRPVLSDLFDKWYPVGGLVISTDPEKIETIMNLYDIDRFFRFFEVFPKTPGCKVKHLKRMSERLQVDLNEILYFDSDEYQLDEVKSLDITVIRVSPKLGLTYDIMQHGLHEYLVTHNVSRPYRGIEMFTMSPPDMPVNS
ncbi:uncharacterized protein LOC129005505 isoform X1 [Macrosteles quadrilineatus]|uniref:uncharacterized protein LOC129005505 isoform X1 n=1 Tax=Macrosteles quadrilineatus TaxID=74068 RepID=UPI0023E3285A|nr:uncharacterized protein LOC129005505 isoform X1 [Macrosteles quadrilineatus]